MANLISRATGNWLTASTWGLVDTTSLLISQAGSTVVGTTADSTARSAGFTPGAITIDGIAIKLNARTGTTGTMTVELWNNTDTVIVTGTTVTINVSDLPAATAANLDGGWRVFQFASVLLLAAKSYMVQCTTSSASQVTLWTNATANNWARQLRTTTTQAPAAGDDMMVAGEHTGAGAITSRTVTMDSTSATDYGSGVADGGSGTPALAISCSGTLTFGTAAATNYILRLSGNLANFRDGTINVGTTGTPIPRDSTAVVEFDCAADADFGWHNHGGTCNIQGLSRTSGKNVVSCKLNTDEAAAQTVLGVDTDTGWLNGDSVALASTSRTSTEAEVRTLSGNASATELTISAGLTNAHSGTSPTQAEVINLTRNVKIRSVSSTAMSFFHNNQTAVVDIDWTEFANLGQDTITDWRGVSVETTTGSFNMQFCSLHDFEDYGIFLDGTAFNNITIANNVVWAVATVLGFGLITGASTQSNITIDNNVFIACGTVAQAACILLDDIGLTYTNNTITSSAVVGAVYTESNAVYGIFDNNVYHSNNGHGLITVAARQTGVISNYKVWRNNGAGLLLQSSRDLVFDTGEAFGNLTAGVAGPYASLSFGAHVLKSWTFNGDTSFPTASGFQIINIGASGAIIFDACNFGTVSGIKTAHTGADIDVSGAGTALVFLRNTILAGSTEVLGQSVLSDISVVSSQRHDQTAGNHKTWLRNGTLSTDTAIFNTAAPSMRMTPLSATAKVQSASMFRGVAAAVNNSGTVTINVFTRKSTAGDGAAYNGAQPRLIVKANPALGSSFNSDTVLDTHTAAAGTWEQLSGTTASVTDDGALEFVVDCDGTAGWINVDDWSIA